MSDAGSGDADKPGIWHRLFGNDRELEPELDEEAQELVDNAAAFDALCIEDIMVPRADIKAVEANASLRELVDMFVEAAHSRLPVYRENLDDPVGMVHIKDLLPFLHPDRVAEMADATGILDKIKREVLYVPASMQADDLLLRMQNTHVHMALVVDEYGGTDGLVTMEDLVEQIVGDIEDEHDTDVNFLRKVSDKEWEASARASIEDLQEATGLPLCEDLSEEDVDTLGGLVFTIAGRVPASGEVLRHPCGLEFEVKKADPRKILTLRVRRTQARTSDT